MVGIVSELANSLKAIGDISESFEKTINTFHNMKDDGKKRSLKKKFTKINTLLSKFRFSPMGVRKDLDVFIHDPTQENLSVVSETLQKNAGLLKELEEQVYNNADANSFHLPLKNLDEIYGLKSGLHEKLRYITYELEAMGPGEKRALFAEMDELFENFNSKLEVTAKKITVAINNI